MTLIPTPNDKRELYKAMRSAHDDICPMCGGITKLFKNDVLGCCSCSFSLSKKEVDEIRTWHEDFHRDIKTILHRWRNYSE